MTSSTARRWLGRAIAVLLLLAGIAIAFGQQGRVVLKSLDDDLAESTQLDEPFNDYRDTGYLAGRDVREGENPYDHESFLARHPNSHEFDLYGPQWFLVHTPLSLLSFVAAKVIWVLAGVAGAFVLAHLSRRLAGLPSDVWWDIAITGVILGSAPGKNAVYLGQPATWAVVAVVLVLLGRQQRPWLGAIGLTIAMVKPQLGVLLALLVGFGFGWWRTVIRGALLTVAAALVPLVAMVVAAGPGDFAQSISDNLSYTSDLYANTAVATEYERLDAVNTLAKVFDVKPTSPLLLAELVVAVAVGVIAIRARRRACGDDAVVSDPLALVMLFGALLFGAFHPLYDGLLAVPAVVVLLVCWRQQRRIDPGTLVAGALLAVPIVYFPALQKVIERVGASKGLSHSVDSIAITAAFVVGAVVALRAADVSDGRDAALARRS
jgi:hypothetical protein